MILHRPPPASAFHERSASTCSMAKTTNSSSTRLGSEPSTSLAQVTRYGRDSGDGGSQSRKGVMSALRCSHIPGILWAVAGSKNQPLPLRPAQPPQAPARMAGKWRRETLLMVASGGQAIWPKQELGPFSAASRVSTRGTKDETSQKAKDSGD